MVVLESVDGSNGKLSLNLYLVEDTNNFAF